MLGQFGGNWEVSVLMEVMDQIVSFGRSRLLRHERVLESGLKRPYHNDGFGI